MKKMGSKKKEKRDNEKTVFKYARESSFRLTQFDTRFSVFDSLFSTLNALRYFRDLSVILIDTNPLTNTYSYILTHVRTGYFNISKRSGFQLSEAWRSRERGGG